jgi:CRP/FNR family transcriptional regulator, cyclic AMP receptor protein
VAVAAPASTEAIVTPLELSLSRHPFFQEFDQAHLAALSACANTAVFDAGTYLFREGEPAHAFFAIQRGRIAIASLTPHEGPVTIQTVGDGDLLGWSWMLPPFRWHFGARAIEATSVVAFNAACVREQLEIDPRLGFLVMRRFAQVMGTRLEAVSQQLTNVYEHRR